MIRQFTTFLFLTPAPAIAATGAIAIEIQAALLVLSVTAIILLILLIRSHQSNQHHRFHLTNTKTALEKRVRERTEKLRKINDQLHEEIARHEITEELLSQTQDYLHSILNRMPSQLVGFTEDHLITLWNSEMERITGVSSSEALNKSLSEVFPEILPFLDDIEEKTEYGHTFYMERIRCPLSVDEKYSNVTGFSVSDENGGTVVRLDDVTDQVKLDRLLVQNEKMLSLGELAAGMAHEINNPLAGILQGTQNLKRRLSKDFTPNQKAAHELGLDMDVLESYLENRDASKIIEGIQDAGERASNIVTNMLEFARNRHGDQAQVNLAKTIKRSVDLILATIEFKDLIKQLDINLTIQAREPVPEIIGSSAELEQVFMNLIKNAYQAIAESPVKIPNPKIQIKIQPQPYWVEVSVSDNGPGIPEDIRRHVFEPFFTTKEVGRGTGLGLSVSYFIITSHHKGTITIDNGPNHGCRFVIRLPKPDCNYDLNLITENVTSYPENLPGIEDIPRRIVPN